MSAGITSIVTVRVRNSCDAGNGHVTYTGHAITIRLNNRNMSKIEDAILGFAIGDALGVPYEFKKRDTFLCADMIGYGTHHKPAGTWSDDTSMTLATLDSLKAHGGKIVTEDICTQFNYWLLYGDYTTDDDVFDAGVTTCTALKKGKPAIGEWDNGNGSLMRVLPLAFVDCTDDEIRAVSAITHGHWISEEACVIYVHVAKRLLAGETISSIIPTLRFDKPFDRLHVDRTQIKSSGYVVDTLEAALWAVSHEGDWEKDFRNDILTAVNLGSDTDTVAAVAGGLAGIIYGLDDVQDWVDRLQNREEIERYLF